jgi:hypothetical protein
MAANMDKAIKTALDFVEGRLSGKEFEQILYSDQDLEHLLQDESLKWHNTYIKSNPYYFLIQLNYDDPGGLLNAQGAVALFLKTRGVSFQADRSISDLHWLLLSVQPKWVGVDAGYLAKHLLPKAEGRTDRELKDWLKAKVKELFRYHRKPPKWIQSPNWPITENGPLYFLGQIKLESCELFHDDGAAFLFLDPKTGETRTVIQLY